MKSVNSLSIQILVVNTDKLIWHLIISIILEDSRSLKNKNALNTDILLLGVMSYIQLLIFSLFFF